MARAPSAPAQAGYFQRGVREQVAIERMRSLHPLAVSLLSSALSRSAGPQSDPTETECTQWNLLHALLVRTFPRLEAPFLVNSEQTQTFCRTLAQRDVPFVRLTLCRANLAAFTYCLISARHSSLSHQDERDEQAARGLAACADAVATQCPPFTLDDRDVQIGMVLELRTQALSCVGNRDRLATMERMFGPDCVFSAEYRELGRTLSEVRRSDLQKLSREEMIESYPYDDALDSGIEYARMIYERMDPGSGITPPLPAMAPSYWLVFGDVPEQIEKEAQVERLLAASRSTPSTLHRSSWEPTHCASIIGGEARRALLQLPSEVLESLLGNITPMEDSRPAGVHHAGDAAEEGVYGGSGVASRLRFGPLGILTTDDIGSKAPRCQFFETQSDGVRIDFNSSSPADERKPKRGGR